MTTDGFTTCLWFDGRAEEAANFYVSIFDNSSIGRITHYGEVGPGTAGEVMVVEFTANGQRFIALNGGPQFTFNESVSFQILCADQDEVDHYWDKLTDGGAESQCGWLKDRFGVSWQVVPTEFLDMISGPDPDPAKVARATEAMLTMRKLDLPTLRKAYDGT